MELIPKKLSISEQQVDLVKDLVAQKISGRAIAAKLGVSQPKLWRNMELLGVNKKKNFCHPKVIQKKEFFDWNDYKDKSLI